MEPQPKMHFDAWRIFRILSEFVEGFEKMTDMGPSVSIFGSARVSPDSQYYQVATEIAKKISKRGFGIITGGGPGIMEAANKGAQLAQGKSCGINVNLPYEEEANPYIDKKYRLQFRYFFVRKVLFIRYAQAFIFLPGGFGTLDELFEALTLIQTNKISRFPIFLIGKEHWQGLLDWLRSATLKKAYLNEEDFSLLTLTDDPDFVVDEIERHYKLKGAVPTFSLENEQQG